MGRPKRQLSIPRDFHAPAPPVKVDIAGSWQLEQSVDALAASIDRLCAVIESLDHAVLNLPDRLAVAVKEASN